MMTDQIEEKKGLPSDEYREKIDELQRDMERDLERNLSGRERDESIRWGRDVARDIIRYS